MSAGRGWSTAARSTASGEDGSADVDVVARSTDPGALTSSSTPAAAAAVCSVCLGALVRAGVRLAGVRAVVDFVVEVRAVVVLAPAALVAGFAAVERAVVDLGVFGALVVSADSVDSGVPAAAVDFAGVRFAAVVRAVVDLVAVVFAAEVRAVVERAVVVLGAGVAVSPDSPEVWLADVVRVRGVVGRFAGAFAVPDARGVVERGARFGAVGAAAAWSSEAIVGAGAPAASAGFGVPGLVDVPSAGAGC
ncbi:hypothetical protein [Plantibacter sp. ME-Dv--P-122b]|uniref:hypothetical protein n=1 Tax=Plantibacter sp. ME-Dv--P-122b TaxID=3040300 RepID=UPI00255137AC|nr:hypothetical protein [Plantibacter sp. ME-Dv--P-122b]